MGRGDQALLDAARSGDDGAFTELYRRHVGAARREACRRSARSNFQEDAVALAFSSVFRAILNGGGPDEHFRAYLLAAVRNAVTGLARRRGVEFATLHDHDVVAEPLVDPGAEAVGAMMEAALLTLNDRQRHALWATEVDGTASSEVARSLQLTDNAFAALKTRARHNLCTAYITQVIGDVDACDWVTERLQQFVRGDLAYGSRLVVEMHVDSCVACESRLPATDTRRRSLFGLPLLLAAPAMVRARTSGAPAGHRVGRVARLARGRTALVVVAAVGVATIGLVVVNRRTPSEPVDAVRTAVGGPAAPAPGVAIGAASADRDESDASTDDVVSFTDEPRPSGVAEGLLDRGRGRFGPPATGTEVTTTLVPGAGAEGEDAPAAAPSDTSGAPVGPSLGDATGTSHDAGPSATAAPGEAAAPPDPAPGSEPATATTSPTTTAPASATTTVAPPPADTVAPTTTFGTLLVGTIAPATSLPPLVVVTIAPTTTLPSPWVIPAIPTTTGP